MLVFVCRYNSVLSAQHTGMKTDILIYKDEYRERGQEDAHWRTHVPLLYMLNRKQTLSLTKRGRPVLVLGPGQSTFDHQVRDLIYRIYMDDKGKTSETGSLIVISAGRHVVLDSFLVAGLKYKDTMRPTTGFKRVMAIIASGLCSRVDLYGYSSGGGKYFHQKAKPLKHHSLAAEHYAYRVLMSRDRVCIYGL